MNLKLQLEPIEPAWLTVAETCEYLRISKATLYRLMAAGTGPPIAKVGHRTMFPLVGIRRWTAGLTIAGARTS